jgi:PhnB protein
VVGAETATLCCQRERTPYLCVRGGAAAIEFYRMHSVRRRSCACPARVVNIGHAEIEIGGSRIMLADEYPEIDFLSPAARGGTTVTIHLYVPDAQDHSARDRGLCSL